MRPTQHQVLPLPGKLLRLAVVACLCLLPQGLSAQAVVDLSLAAARGGFRPAVARAWELACAGWYDGALAVVSEARRHTTNADEISKLDAMIVTYTMLKQRADVAANVPPATSSGLAPTPTVASAPPPAPAPLPPPAPAAVSAPAAKPAAVPGALSLSIHTGPSPAELPASANAVSAAPSARVSTPVPAAVVARELGASAAPVQPAPASAAVAAATTPATPTAPPAPSVQVSLSAAAPAAAGAQPAPAQPAEKRRRFGWLPWRRAAPSEPTTVAGASTPTPGAAATTATPSVAVAEASPRRSLLGRLAVPRLSADAAGDWEFALGPALRQGGGTVDFTRQSLRRPDGGEFVNGHHSGRGDFLIEGDPADGGSSGERVSPQLDPVGWQTVDPNGVPNSGDETYFRNVTFDRSVLTGASAGLDSSWALSAEASRTLGKNLFRASRLKLGLDLSHSQANATASQGRGISTTTLTGILYTEGGAIPSNLRPVTPYQEEAGAVIQGGPTNYGMTEELFEMGGARTTDVTVELEAEAYVATLSAGLQYDLELNSWSTLFAGVGPALHLALAKSSLDQRATWDAPASSLDGTPVQNFANSESDSAFALCGGLFLAVGARAQLTRGLALDLSLRYDEMLGTVETEHAEFDLSGLVGQIRLIYTF